MNKADYSKIATFYDRGRLLSERNTEVWISLISRLSGASKGDRVLDLGCGTGRFSLPLAHRMQFKVTGADLSSEMLAKAKQKDPAHAVNWVLADAEALIFPKGSFDVIFMSHLLHHVDSPPTVLRECHRVLASAGAILIRYGAIDQIRNDVEHTLFPEATDIDEARTPTVEITEKWLVEAGFENISSEEVIQQTYQSGLAHLNAARMKSTSVLSMISEQSFQTGINRLAGYVDENPNDDWLLFDKMTMTVGYKRPLELKRAPNIRIELMP